MPLSQLIPSSYSEIGLMFLCIHPSSKLCNLALLCTNQRCASVQMLCIFSEWKTTALYPREYLNILKMNYTPWKLRQQLDFETTFFVQKWNAVVSLLSCLPSPLPHPWHECRASAEENSKPAYHSRKRTPKQLLWFYGRRQLRVNCSLLLMHAKQNFFGSGAQIEI